MDNMEFAPKSEQESADIQRLLFDLGFRWSGRIPRKILFTKSPYLFANVEDMSITYSFDSMVFTDTSEHDHVFTDYQMLKRMVKKERVESELADMKFIVEDPYTSRRVQEKLFMLGYKWMAGEQMVQLTDQKYLITRAGQAMSIAHCGNSDEYFRVCNATLCTEKTLDSLLSKMNGGFEVKDEGKHVPYPGQSAESFFTEVACQGVAQKVEFNGVGLWVDPYTADRYGVKAEVDRLMTLYTTQTYAG